MTGSRKNPKIRGWVLWFILVCFALITYQVFPPFALFVGKISAYKHYFYIAFGVLWFINYIVSGEYKKERVARENRAAQYGANFKKDRYDARSKGSRKNNTTIMNESEEPLSWRALVCVLGLGGALGVGLVVLPSLQSDNLAQSRKTKSSSAPPSRPVSQSRPKPPKPKYDPALAVKDQVSFYEDSRFPNLTTEDYKKAAGDLARIQHKMLINRRQSKNYPSVLIGRGDWVNRACNELLPSLGLYQYGPGCDGLITINFEANNVVYEHQIEVLVTLAHEWGHHLVHLSGEKISGINNELMADCFAGVYIAYLGKHGAISEQEFRSTVQMMGVLGNTHGTGVHGTPAQRINGLLSGALFFDDPSNRQNQANWDNYCKGLEDVIDIRKSLP